MKKQSGVSIAEMAVVILIIAVLAGVVSGGLKMKKASELRGFMTQISSFQVAIESFDNKYSDWPGDMGDAHSYWDDGADGVCGTAAECNGDADGTIELSATDGDDSESFRAWQHLSLAGFIDGGYSGTATTSVDQADIGINIPAGKRAKTGYYLTYGNIAGGNNRNEMRLGAFKANEVNSNPALSPQEAYSIDNKMDDGDPDDGIVLGANSVGTCVDSSEYLRTSSAIACIMSFPVTP